MSEREATIERLKEKAAAEAGDETMEITEEAVASLDETVEDDPKKSTVREYVILRKWDEAARVEAGSAEAALKILSKDDGSYAAIPTRNFNVFEIKTETTTVTHVTPAA